MPTIEPDQIGATDSVSIILVVAVALVDVDGRVLIAQRPEGKSMAGLIDMVRSEKIPAGSRVLYAHLGGQPALPAYAGFPGLGSAERELSH